MWSAASAVPWPLRAPPWHREHRRGLERVESSDSPPSQTCLVKIQLFKASLLREMDGHIHV